MPQATTEAENLPSQSHSHQPAANATSKTTGNGNSGTPQHVHSQQQSRPHGENRDPSKVHHHSSGSRRDVSNNNTVGVHFKVGRRIGEGSFGIIYDGINTLTNQHVAIKYESRKSEAPQLRDEYRTYKLLAGFPGIPTAYYFGTENMYNILIIDLLGPSLEDLFDSCNRKFSVKTVCLAAKQMLCRVQSVHEKSLVYRDIKPDNFLVGRIPPYVDPSTNPALQNSSKDINSILKNHSKENPHPASKIYLIDFGMAKFYRDPKTLQHIPYKEKRSLSGTARYMSINTHLGREQSRRDDLEGLGHVLMYFLRGSLPWQGMKAATNKQKYEKIGEKKRTTSIKELCDGFPEEFSTYMTYVRKLGFEETPDYDYLRGLFDKVLKRMGEKDDDVFDWMIELEEQRNEITRLREKQRLSNMSPPPKVAASGTNLKVPSAKLKNENTVQNSSMQVLGGGGTCSVDEITGNSISQNHIDDHCVVNYPSASGTIQKLESSEVVNSPLNNEIKTTKKVEANDNTMNTKAATNTTDSSPLKIDTVAASEQDSKNDPKTSSNMANVQVSALTPPTPNPKIEDMQSPKNEDENEKKKEALAKKKKNKKVFGIFSCCRTTTSS